MLSMTSKINFYNSQKSFVITSAIDDEQRFQRECSYLDIDFVRCEGRDRGRSETSWLMAARDFDYLQTLHSYLFANQKTHILLGKANRKNHRQAFLVKGEGHFALKKYIGKLFQTDCKTAKNKAYYTQKNGQYFITTLTPDLADIER